MSTLCAYLLLFITYQRWEYVDNYVVEDIASEMHHMNISAKLLIDIQRNFKDDAVSDSVKAVFYF